MVPRAQVADGLTANVFASLAAWTTPPCISIYVPLDPKNPGTSADRIRLKDLVRNVRKQLEERALGQADVDELIAPLGQLSFAEMWSARGRGWALFRARGQWLKLDVSSDVPPLAVVSDRFVVTPLLAAIPPPGTYYLLAVSQHRVRLFVGDHALLDEVEVDGIPASLSDALWYEEPARQVNIHGGGSRGAGGALTTTYGSIAERDLHDDQLMRFFRAVDDAVSAAIVDASAPLIVAGVAYELAIYRRSSRYPRLACLLPIGNPDHLGAVELHERSWPFARDALDEEREEHLRRLNRSREPLTSVPGVLAACRQGRVATLFVRPDGLAWGTIDDDRVSARAERQPGDVELYSAAIGAAIAQGATVFPLRTAELADNVVIAGHPRF